MAWTDLRTQGELDEVTRAFGGFHDACLHEIRAWQDMFVDKTGVMHHATGSRLHARLLIQRQLPSAPPEAIELWFEEVVHLQLTEIPEGFDNYIAAATFIVHDGVFYWADVSDWTPLDPGPTKWDTSAGWAVGPASWIGARRVRWRAAPEGLGEEPRYSRDRD